MKRIIVIGIALAAVLFQACDMLSDYRLKNDFWKEGPPEMEQHQFQIETEILTGIYWYWNNSYASFVEKWPDYYSENKEPELVFSNRRWYPAEYGPFFWRDFDLDNRMYPGQPATYYYDCDSHPYVKTDLGDGSFKIEVDFLGYQWSGILTPGEDCILRTEYSDEFRLRRLPADAVYDHSLDELLMVARETGRKK